MTAAVRDRLQRLQQAIERHLAGELPADLVPALIGELYVCGRLLAMEPAGGVDGD